MKAQTIAQKIQDAGHQVSLLTRSLNNEPDRLSFKVMRKPNVFQIFKLFAQAHVVVLMNLSFKGLFPALLLKKNILISHENTYYNQDGTLSVKGKLKYFFTRFAHANLCCSSYVANFISKNAIITWGPLRNDVFKKYIEDKFRALDIVFLGRLVSDKGCDLLIRAIAIVKDKYKLHVTVSVIGEGDQLPSLQLLTNTLQLSSNIIFKGTLKGDALVQCLNQHKLMVVPSLWPEPFGLVAIEGLACGCRIIVSNRGGLNEAVGNYGLQFNSGDAHDLADKIYMMLNHDPINYLGLSEHLQRFQPDVVAAHFLNIIEKKN